jgi:hypothetical protein
MEGLARLAAKRQPAHSATLLGAAERLREVIGHLRRRDHADAELVAGLRSELGEQAFSVAWETGRDLALDRAIERALGLDESGSVDIPGSSSDEHRLAGQPAELRTVVEGALRHLNDMPTLSQHPLLGRTPSTAGSNRPAAEAATLLRGDLVQAIERLRPSTPRPSPGNSNGPGGWLHFLVLYEAYVEGRPNKQIMQRYYLSEGTFHRARRGAIDTLARDLAQRTARLTPGTPVVG